MTDKEVIKQAAESLAVIVAWWNGLPYAQGGEKHQTHTAAEAALDNCLKALAEPPTRAGELGAMKAKYWKQPVKQSSELDQIDDGTWEPNPND